MFILYFWMGAYLLFAYEMFTNRNRISGVMLVIAALSWIRVILYARDVVGTDAWWDTHLPLSVLLCFVLSLMMFLLGSFLHLVLLREEAHSKPDKKSDNG